MCTDAARFRDARGLQFLVSNQLEALQTSHQTLIDMLQQLGAPPSPALIGATVECCLRPTGEILKT